MAKRGSALGTLVVKVRADTGSLNVSLKKAQKSVQRWGTKTQESLAGIAKRMGKSFRALLTPVNALGTALGAAFSVTKIVQAAADYETALVGVKKTTGLAGDELAKFESDMGDFVKRFAIGKIELLELAEAAGQLGVETKELGKFTKIMAEMAKASDVAGEEGAKAIARLLTITQEGVGVADNFTNTLVGLGNSAKASEGEILDMATRVAQATAVFGVSSVDILGLSTALKEMGDRSESAGSSVGRAMIAINASIQAGGKEAAAMASFMGTSVEKLTKSFEDNAFDTFLTFLDRLGDQGRGATETLKKFEIAGAQNTKTLLTLAGNMDLVRSKLSDSSSEWEKNNARVNEAAAANETAASKFQILKNNIAELSVSIGNQLLPAVKSILTEINFVLGESESRAERFVLFMKAKAFALLNAISSGVKSVGTLIVSVFVKAFLEVREALQMALKGMLIEIEKFVNGAAGALNSILPSQFEIGGTSLSGIVPDYEAPSFDQVVLDVGTVFGVDSGSINPYQDDLDAAMARATADRGIDARNSLPDVQEVAKVAEGVKKVADELDRVAGKGKDGNPQGDRSIDTTLLGGSGSKEAVENVEKVQEKLTGMGEALTVYQQEIASFGEATFDKLTDFVTEFAEKGAVDFQKFANQAIAELARIQLKALATKAILGLAESGGATGSIFGGVAKFFGLSGARADGGPVSGGSTYLVGERGPELFSPKRSGNIIPNEALTNGSETGGGLAFTQVNHYDGNPNEQQMAIFAQQTKNSAIEGVMEIIAHGGQPAKAFSV